MTSRNLYSKDPKVYTGFALFGDVQVHQYEDGRVTYVPIRDEVDVLLDRLSAEDMADAIGKVFRR